MTFHKTGLGMFLSTILLSACATPPPEPDHSTDYSYVPTGQNDGAKGVQGSVLVPNDCLKAPADQEPTAAGTRFMKVPQVGPHLPPGCANAFNLQRMVENERDLIEGRPMGPPPAAPSVRAARRYIYGTKEAPEQPQDKEPQSF
ncbi:hypothetical protein F9K97_23905 [Brucella anthropi]|uniref:hypothetical protein n=1 Tax=Brucella/Ochrobactrum group TaxID=2826938 RepID=UPI00124E6A4A|nr:hypothetical protein [Brucella anthropi]KAB2736264.1 hypothetical protein F9K89_17075 [Brucella anthropi]KAB2775731.1 hypothetical protein F9K97_23905 [Brucella anthropi]MBA8839824.1 hypothetical protein [Ochrobactrum sp. RH2CCR150]